MGYNPLILTFDPNFQRDILAGWTVNRETHDTRGSPEPDFMIADDGIYGTGYLAKRIICFWSWNMSEYISGTKNGSTHPFWKKLYVFLKSETI